MTNGNTFRLTRYRLACAAVPRFDIVSGWDFALQQPKTAQRVAPAGSIYWFDQLEGDAGKLAALVAGGLWVDNHDKQRRAEGFNRAWLGRCARSRPPVASARIR